MTDELEVIAGLEPEQIVERAKALVLEAEYWRHVLGDCRTGAAALRGVVGAIINSTTSALALVLQLEPGLLVHAESVVAHNRRAMDEVEKVIDVLDGIVTLSDGRAKALAPVGDALRRAAGVEPGAEAEGEAS